MMQRQLTRDQANLWRPSLRRKKAPEIAAALDEYVTAVQASDPAENALLAKLKAACSNYTGADALVTAIIADIRDELPKQSQSAQPSAGSATATAATPTATTMPAVTTTGLSSQTRDEILSTLRRSAFLERDIAQLKKKHAASQDACKHIDTVVAGIRQEQGTWKISPELAKISDVGTTMKRMKTLDELESLCSAIAAMHGISPLEMIELALADRSHSWPIQNEPLDECKARIAKVRDQWVQASGEKPVAGGSVIPSQAIDPRHRVPPMFNERKDIGPEARHAEEIMVTGNRSRQLVLGVGSSKQPHSYSNFARDYGLWDFESWATYNKQLGAFAQFDLDPSQGGDVDELLKAKKGQEDVIERLHFRLQGVFEGLGTIKERVVAALALYEDKLARSGVFHGYLINSLWTCGEVRTIMHDNDLIGKTAFYGDQNDYAEASSLVTSDLTNVISAKQAEFNKIGEDLAAGFKGDPAEPEKLEFTSRGYFYIPHGAARVKDEIVADEKASWKRLRMMQGWT